MSYLLANPLFDKALSIEEDQPFQIIIENPTAFTKFLTDLQLYVDNQSSNTIISKDLKEIKPQKQCQIIYDFINIDANNKQIITKLFSNMTDLISNEQFVCAKNQIDSSIQNVIEQMSDMLCVNLDYDLSTDFKYLLKSLDVKLDIQTTTDLLDKLCQFSTISSKLLGTNIFIFVNLKSYVNVNQLQQLYKHFAYNKITPILIENYQLSILDQETTVIIDKDLCQIC